MSILKETFTPRNLVKIAIRGAAGGTASYTVQKLINKVVDLDELETKERVAVNVGSVSIGLAVSEAVGTVTDDYVDVVFETRNAVREMQNDEEHVVIDHDPNE